MFEGKIPKSQDDIVRIVSRVVRYIPMLWFAMIIEVSYLL